MWWLMTIVKSRYLNNIISFGEEQENSEHRPHGLTVTV